MVEACATYKNHPFPIEIVAHAVWLYYRFGLSLLKKCCWSGGSSSPTRPSAAGDRSTVPIMHVACAAKRHQKTMSGILILMK